MNIQTIYWPMGLFLADGFLAADKALELVMNGAAGSVL